MNALAIEWIEKAEGDFATAQRERRARTRPNYDAACFHAQQCAEKYLKALLAQHGAAFPKTHHLIDLLDLCLRHDPMLEPWRPTLLLLGPYGVRYRYPGESAERADALAAIRALNTFRAFMRTRLGVSPTSQL
ncbi:MAG: HEPN domain-containing protein [Anaerolineae bacterium]